MITGQAVCSWPDSYRPAFVLQSNAAIGWRFPGTESSPFPGGLHARGKSNEQFAKNLQPLTEDDAEFALHSLGLALRDPGWAR